MNELTDKFGRLWKKVKSDGKFDYWTSTAYNPPRVLKFPVGSRDDAKSFTLKWRDEKGRLCKVFGDSRIRVKVAEGKPSANNGLGVVISGGAPDVWVCEDDPSIPPMECEAGACDEEERIGGNGN